MGKIQIKTVQVTYSGFCEQCFEISNNNEKKMIDKYILTIGGNNIHLCKKCLINLHNTIGAELGGADKCPLEPK